MDSLSTLKLSCCAYLFSTAQVNFKARKANLSVASAKPVATRLSRGAQHVSTANKVRNRQDSLYILTDSYISSIYPGQFAPVDESTTCQDCAPGFLALRTGSSVCTQCQPGFFIDSTGDCTQCSQGRYSDVVAATACEKWYVS